MHQNPTIAALQDALALDAADLVWAVERTTTESAQDPCSARKEEAAFAAWGRLRRFLADLIGVKELPLI